LTLADRKQS